MLARGEESESSMLLSRPPHCGSRLNCVPTGIYGLLGVEMHARRKGVGPPTWIKTAAAAFQDASNLHNSNVAFVASFRLMTACGYIKEHSFGFVGGQQKATCTIFGSSSLFSKRLTCSCEPGLHGGCNLVHESHGSRDKPQMSSPSAKETR